MLSLFHRYSYICKPISGGAWFSANEQWKLSDTEILKAIACAHPKYFLGCRAGKATRYAVLDIDAGSAYHNRSSVNKIRQVLSSAGLTKTQIYRSSDSGGWHLYLLFDEPISSKDLRNQLVLLLQLNAFKIAKGTLEVFPHPGEGSNGQGLRLPLQPGFAWLDQISLEVDEERFELSPTKALELFVDVINSWSNTRHDFHHFKSSVERLASTKQAIKERIQTAERTNNVVPLRKQTSEQENGSAYDLVKAVFRTSPPGIISDIWQRGRTYYLSGLTGPSQRADAIHSLGHYLFYGDPENGLPARGYGYEDERRLEIEQILVEKHHGFSNGINCSHIDAMSQVSRATSWVPPQRREKDNLPYVPTTPIAWIRHNANLKVDAQNKIQKAVAAFEADQKAFSIRVLSEASGCSVRTLYKHERIWRPVQQKLQAIHFAGVLHEYNAGVGGVLPENPSLSSTRSEKMPPGRLAARRLVYEMNMRAARSEKKTAEEKQLLLVDLDLRWQEQVTSDLPEVFSDCSNERLEILISKYVQLLPGSPDEASQSWLEGLLAVARAELVQRESFGDLFDVEDGIQDDSLLQARKEPVLVDLPPIARPVLLATVSYESWNNMRFRSRKRARKMRKLKLILFVYTLAIATVIGAMAKDVQVQSYTKKDGTKVEGYTRHTTDPDKVKVKGYTKKDGTVVAGYERKKTKAK